MRSDCWSENLGNILISILQRLFFDKYRFLRILLPGNIFFNYYNIIKGKSTRLHTFLDILDSKYITLVGGIYL